MRTFFVYGSIIISFLLVSNSTHAQLFDSISNSFNYKPKPLVKLEARNAFVTSSFVKMKGIKIGLNYHRKVRLGIGYTWMKDDYDITYKQDSGQLNFGYGLAFFEYSFHHSKHWHLEIPIQIGLGKISYQKDESILVHQWAPIWEPAMTMEYIFLKYFGIGVGAGYRIVFKAKSPITEQLTSPIYIFRFRVYLGDIYKDIKTTLD